MPIKKVHGGYKWGGHGHVYPTRAGAERQARAAYANGYRGDGKSRLAAAKKRRLDMYRTDNSDLPFLPNYPPDHQVGTEVPDGGSCCANCDFYDDGKCGAEAFQKWNGGDVIPLPDGNPERYCCDLWS